MKVEAVIEKIIMKEAGSHGWVGRKICYRGERNCPDAFFVRDGRVVFIEFKSPGEKPRPGQRKEIERLRKAGAEVHAADSMQQAREILGL